MKSIEEIKDEVCWDHGYINYENFKKELKNPESTSHKELNTVMLEIARRYARETEKYYIDYTD